MGRDLHHAVRREGSLLERARPFGRGRGRRIAAPACAITISILIWSASIARAEPDSAPTPARVTLSAEQACDAIRFSLHKLARAEHEQAFALDLSAGEGGSTPIVATRLAKLLECSSNLRDTLRSVRARTAAGDPRVEDCMKMGFHALADAERLTTTVEEVLYGNDASAQIKSDAMRTAPAPQP